jgi:SNW domain-containing protein 1
LYLEGKIRYDSIIQQPGAHQIVKSQYKDLVPILNYTPDDVARPSPDEEKETTEKTKAALEKLTQQKLMASQPTEVCSSY